jgi:Glycosyltransferase family 87
MRRAGSLLLLFCAGISIWWGLNIGSSVPGGVIDFQAVYYGTRCLLNHCDPYQEDQLVHQFEADGHELPSDSIRRKVVTVCVNMPTTFVFIAPLALLSWGPAHTLWIVLLASGIIFASSLIWRTGAMYAPGVSLFLTCLLLVNSEVSVATGNTAGIVISMCAIAVWCFLNNRIVSIGVLCFAVALAIKPHDAGLLWLYFLLTAGAHRKRALQSLAATSAIALAAFLWVSHAAPHWLSEMRANLASNAMPGGLSEPGFASVSGRTPAMVIDLQAVTSAIWSDPHAYNLASYLVCGILILVWSFTTLRTRFSVSNACLALATAAPLTLLVTYHRPYDTKLLLLTIPACTILWAEGGAIGWVALILSASAILLTGDVALAVVSHYTKGLDLSAVSHAHKILVGILSQPAPLVLLVLAAFYLSVYVRFARRESDIDEPGGLRRTGHGANPDEYKRTGEGSQAKTPASLDETLHTATAS